VQKNDGNVLHASAPLWRRLMAMLYDSLLLVALLILAALPVVVFFGGIPGGWARHIFQFYLLAVWFLFIAWFWVHGGQTLGMRSWRLQLISTDGADIDWKTALLRFVFALLSALTLAAGYLWVLIDPFNRAWHDRISGSFVVLLPKKKD